MKPTITIIGGGLSGLSLACYLQNNGVQVNLVEQGSYPRHKVCGEFICGVNNETLTELGIEHCLTNAREVKNIQWYMGERQILDKKLPLQGIGISRYLLDDNLQQHFRLLGGNLTRKRVNRSDYYNNSSEPMHDTVWACGKEKQGKGKDARRWLGMKFHITNINIEGLEMHTGIQSKKGGYIGLSPIENNKVNVCGLFEVNKSIKGQGAKTLILYLQSLGMEKLANRIQQATILTESFSTVAGFSMGNQGIIHQSNKNLLPIGDAAALIPPFTGNGMSMALESALLAGQYLLPYYQNKSEIPWEHMVKNYHEAFQRKFNKRMLTSKCLHPLFFHPSGRQVLSALAKTRLIPFNTLFHLIRS